MERLIDDEGWDPFLSSVNYYSIGVQRFCVESYGDFDSVAYLRALDHLKIPGGGSDEVKIKLIESKSTGINPPDKWLCWKEINPYNGELSDFEDDHCGVFNTGEPSFILIHYTGKSIWYWVDDFSLLPPNETAAPLRAVFHHWFKNTSFFLCHAAGLGLGSTGTLLTGKSGSGKSTSTLACLESDLRYAGDDFLLVDSESCMAYSLYGVAKLNTDQFERFKHLKKFITNVEHMPKEKGHVYISEEFPASMVNRFSIKSVLIPTVTGQLNTYIERCSKTEVLKALVPSSVWILRSDTLSVHKMKRLIARLPSYRLFAGTVLEEIPQQIKAHLNES